MGEAINGPGRVHLGVPGQRGRKFIARLAPASSGKDKSSKKQKDDTPRSTPVQKSRPAEQPQEVAEAGGAEAGAPKQEARAARRRPEKAPSDRRGTTSRRTRHRGAPEPERADERAKHAARRTARDDEPAELRRSGRAAADCSPSSSTDTSRISTLRTLPVTVIGNSSTT